MTIAFPELDEIEGKLNTKRAELAAIFAEAKTDGGELDLARVKSLGVATNAEGVEIVRARNEEIDELSTKAEGLRVLKTAAGHAEAAGRVERTDAEPAHKSLADSFFASQACDGETIRKNVTVELDMDLKAVMSTSAGWAADVERRDIVVPKAERPIELIDLLPATTTGAVGSVTYWEETTFTNGAAETAENSPKPEGALVLTERTAPIRKIPVLLPVTDEQLEDRPRVRALINNRLPFMVRQRLSNQIASGDGSAPNLRGILNVSGIQTQAKGSDPVPDAVYKAMVKVMTTGQAVPDAYVTNPLDWQDVRLLRTTDGIYIWGSPSDPGPARIWGLRVVLAQGMTENTGVVGDFANFSELAVRKALAVDVGLNADDFGNNRQTFRAETRVALIWSRPAAFATVTGI